MKQEFKIAIVSNGHSDVIQNTLKEMQIDYYSLCKKPGKKYFLQAADKMGLEPENILVIGNEAIMDVWGGNRSRNVYCCGK